MYIYVNVYMSFTHINNNSIFNKYRFILLIRIIYIYTFFLSLTNLFLFDLNRTIVISALVYFINSIILYTTLYMYIFRLVHRKIKARMVQIKIKKIIPNVLLVFFIFSSIHSSIKYIYSILLIIYRTIYQTNRSVFIFMSICNNKFYILKNFFMKK